MDIHAIRRQYGALAMDEKTMAESPIQQCENWLQDAIVTEQIDPTAFVLSTIDKQNAPDARVLLLKEIQPTGFVFYTHYQSTKGKQLKANPNCSLTFYWPILARQIRIQGTASQLELDKADAYFASRPYLSKLSATVSPQSQVIKNRAVLEDAIEQLKARLPEDSISRPKDWGGYIVKPYKIEFWQGRDNRLHDRLLYTYQDSNWIKSLLAP